jgi:hypothetical protein
MATREQIMRLHTTGALSSVCPASGPIYRADGQRSMNVEFYSGGYQFFMAFWVDYSMQRIVSMHPLSNISFITWPITSNSN